MARSHPLGSPVHRDRVVALRPRRRRTATVPPPAPIEETLGHRFAQPALIQTALTHPSLRGQNGQEPFERLEFLGDRVLGLVIADRLVSAFPEDAEGKLARRHGMLVSEEVLAECAAAIDLGAYLHLSAGEHSSGGRRNPALLADALEAVIAALYLDAGLEVARAFVERIYGDRIRAITPPPRDAKTALQEWAQGRGLPLPVYRTVATAGPAHKPVFEIEVAIAGLGAARGRGTPKRVAEQDAARALLEGQG